MNILNKGVPLLDTAAIRPNGNAPAVASGSTDSTVPEAQTKPAPDVLAIGSNSTVIDKSISELNESVQNIQRGIEFSRDEESGRDVIKVMDRDTGRILRQFPSEDALAVSRDIKAFLEARQSAAGLSGAQPEAALGFIMKEQA